MLAGEKTLDEIVLNPLSWYAEHGITLHAGDPVVQIDRVKRLVRRRRRRPKAPTTACCWPPGRTPSSCRCRGDDLPGVIAYRDIADTDAMIAAATGVPACGGDRRRPAGLEAANGLMRAACR